VDLEAFLELPSTTTLYLIDSHRPLHLRNLFGSTQIIAIDDGSISTEMKELRLSYEAVEVARNLKISLIQILEMIAMIVKNMKKKNYLIQIQISKKRNLLLQIKISIRTIGHKFPLMKMMRMMNLQNHQTLQR
jgi:hypothetical protein